MTRTVVALKMSHIAQQLPLLLRVDMLLGSAPVGPTTVERLQKYTGKLPVVRFGSTETCLQVGCPTLLWIMTVRIFDSISSFRFPHHHRCDQVCGTPLSLSEEQRLESFKRGWANEYNGKAENGYYIGQHHEGNTEVCSRIQGLFSALDQSHLLYLPFSMLHSSSTIRSEN